MNLVLYMHNGSYNHGCEAIVRSTTAMMDAKTVLYSANPEEDVRWKIPEVCEVRKQGDNVRHGSVEHILIKLHSALTHSRKKYINKIYKNLMSVENDVDIFMSIGGDNYCYSNMPEQLAYLNGYLNKKGKTVLWGCSIEPDLLDNPAVIEDLKQYSLITARETLTYEALKKCGLNNVHLVADPAFTLKTEKVDLPEIFNHGKVVGLNISPLILKYGDRQLILHNFEKLIAHILGTTDYSIAMIPHVTCNGNSDIQIMKEFVDKFTDKRIVLIDEHNCSQIKYIISNCEMFIGARTHATIAAYSSCVPTLVVGYSVKARGIAKDIFGDEDKYILPVQSLTDETCLIYEFDKLNAEKQMIKEQLRVIMPEYIQKAYDGVKKIEDIK